ncbi:MAG: hypothetical protein JW850_15190 [Thermoflexales bacterium]|nr:hypothetical protein [Thermoflexales bacterium]
MSVVLTFTLSDQLATTVAAAYLKLWPLLDGEGEPIADPTQQQKKAHVMACMRQQAIGVMKEVARIGAKATVDAAVAQAEADGEGITTS